MALWENERCVSARALGNLDRVVASKSLRMRSTQEHAAASAERPVGSVQIYQSGGRIRNLQRFLSISSLVWLCPGMWCVAAAHDFPWRVGNSTGSMYFSRVFELTAVVSCHGSRYNSRDLTSSKELLSSWFSGSPWLFRFDVSDGRLHLQLPTDCRRRSRVR